MYDNAHTRVGKFIPDLFSSNFMVPYVSGVWLTKLCLNQGPASCTRLDLTRGASFQASLKMTMSYWLRLLTTYSEIPQFHHCEAERISSLLRPLQGHSHTSRVDIRGKGASKITSFSWAIQCCDLWRPGNRDPEKGAEETAKQVCSWEIRQTQKHYHACNDIKSYKKECN